jgi:hypothetical protein
MKLKTIILYPTNWQLDVWIGTQSMAECFHKRYGASTEYYTNQMIDNEIGTCGQINSTAKSELKGRYQIVVTLHHFDLDVLVHELSHAFDRLCKSVKLENDSTEWKACMIEYMFKECRKKKDYKTYIP